MAKLSEVVRRLVERDEAPLDRFDVEELADGWSVDPALVRAYADAEWAAFRAGGGAFPTMHQVAATCVENSPVRRAWKAAKDAANVLDAAAG